MCATLVSLVGLVKERPQHTSETDPWLSGTAPPYTTALEMSKDGARLDKLSFGCASLDAVFHGGVPVQGITEVSPSALGGWIDTRM